MNKTRPLTIGLLLGLAVACQPKPAPVAPAPPQDTEPEIEEVVKNELDVLGSNEDPCDAYQSASDAIWSYQTQKDLNLSANIYENRLAAGDAEILIGDMDAFKNRWLALFKSHCANEEKEGILAEGQFDAGVQCLRKALTLQKDYVNRLFHEGVFKLPDEDLPMEPIEECEATALPQGEKAQRDNPF